MKKASLLLSLLFILFTANTQVKIGAPGDPDLDAVLELAGSSRGLLLPRIALTGTSSPAPLSAFVAGMVVYNTANVSDVRPGYFYSDGVRWIRISSAFETWSLAGNAATNPAVQFIGTSDATDLSIRTNSTERMRIYSNGMFDIGINALPGNVRIRMGGTSTGPLAATFGLNGSLNATANGQSLYSIFNSPNFGTGFTHNTITGINTDIFFSGAVNGFMFGNHASVSTTGSAAPTGFVAGIRGQAARYSTGGTDGNFYGGYFSAETGNPGIGVMSEMFGTLSTASLGGTGATNLTSLGGQSNFVLTLNPNALPTLVYGTKNLINHSASSTIGAVYATHNSIAVNSNSVFTEAYGTLSNFQTNSGGGITNCYGHYVSSVAASTNISNFRGIYIGNIGLASGTRRAFEYAGTGTNDPVIINFDGSVQIGNPAPVTNAKLSITDGHLQSGQTTKPTIAPTINIGTGGTASLVDATDIAGIISLDLGSGAWASGPIATVTFNKLYANAPVVVITPLSANSSLAVNSQRPYITTTTAGFTINFGVAASSGVILLFSYHVIETTNN